MTLHPGPLSAFQRCPRAWMQNNAQPAHRWRPKTLFLRVIRKAILGISNKQVISAASDTAVSEFLEAAANPGLEVPEAPFTIARDFASMLRTVLARIHACSLPPLKAGPVIILTPGLKWATASLIAESTGTLHSWITVDYLTDDSLARLLHSWYVFGDCAATALPMILHVIEIGRMSGGHQHSPWCRCFRHPAIAHRFAFQQKGGKPLKGDWKPVWFQDSIRNDPKTWIEIMDRDGVRALKDVPVRTVSADHAQQFRDQMVIEAAAMTALEGKDWRDVPMRRTSCDMPPCTWQRECYQ